MSSSVLEVSGQVITDEERRARHYLHRYTAAKPRDDSRFLIAVNYHWPGAKSLRFLKDTFFTEFSRQFDHHFDVVFFGPGKAKGVVNNGLNTGGHLSYHTLALAVEMFGRAKPTSDGAGQAQTSLGSGNYAGYILMNDDSYVDPYQLNRLNLTHSWTAPSIQLDPTCKKWAWPLARNSHKLTYLQASHNAYKEITRKHKDLAEKCHFELAANRRKGYADFFYIAAGDIDVFMRLESIFFRHQVFLEMAAPTINHCITKRTFVDCNHGKMRRIKKCLHIHPVKMSKKENRVYVVNRLARKNLDARPAGISY